ncbi:iron-sulfur cluster repair di-iron protein [Lentibacillus populi]|uniref:Iron-sulfur cluster repair di-iron protein n=2 Tax=Bacillales TaxID=1385 RepID=A0A9W5U0H5_9BACI|nr:MULTISPECIES: iron-sulfur cluster repair di-iron protein [Bacillaceae]MBT2216213.1 iron-sulfur cluster repair di-iron protein [Virgibacillus dakarensis]GGB53446.1 iron-sulfur cluster repair di-iron protein [Lentibacillus populi]
MGTFTAEHTPAEIVKLFPKASDLFKRRRIDFCCGGDKPLSETFTKRNLNETAVLTELNDAYDTWQNSDHDVVDWSAVHPSELIDHIVSTHHAYLNEELPALGKFVTKILRVHGEKHKHLQELHRLYNEFKVEMEEHMIKEENEVFPLIKEYEKNPSEELLNHIRKANGGLGDEHVAAGNFLKRMNEITNGFEPPIDACNSYRITYARLADMESDTYEHVHLENNVLFKNLA